MTPEQKQARSKARKSLEAKHASAFLNLRSLFGNNWAQYFVVLGSEQSGKSYSVQKYILNCKKRMGDNCKVFWFRMNDTSVKKMLESNASRAIDADLVRKYKLDLKTRGPDIWDKNQPNAKLPIMTVLSLSTVSSSKGVSYYDKDFKGKYVIVCDEFERDSYAGERKTFQSISYNLRRSIENVARATGSAEAQSQDIRVILLGNTLSEASEVLLDFGFIPEPGQFGRYKIRSKKLIVDYVKPSDAYVRMRQGAAVELLTPANMSSSKNMVDFSDQKLLCHKNGLKPVCIIKFTDKQQTWYTLWDNGVIKPYNGETINNVIAMRRYIQNTIYDPQRVKQVQGLYDIQGYLFWNYYTYSAFKQEMIKLKPQR